MLQINLGFSVEIQVKLTCCSRMGPKKAKKNVKKIGVQTDTPTEFELGNTAADIQRMREEREQREGEEEEEAEKQQREERES